MKIRAANSEDREMIRQLYAQSGLEFKMPDLSSPMIEATELVVDERGEVIMAAVAQRTLEIYLFSPAGQLPLYYCNNSLPQLWIDCRCRARCRFSKNWRYSRIATGLWH